MEYSLTIFAVLFCFSFANAQEPPTDGISFDALTEKKDRTELQVYYYKGKKYTGQTYDFQEEGEKVYSSMLKDGLLQVQYAWYDDKTLGRHYQFKDGRLHGNVMLYFGDGTPYIHHIYKNGLMDGQQKSWYNNGQLRMDAWYDMGFKRYQKDYDRDGKQVKTMFSKG